MQTNNWASLVAQWVKSLPAAQESHVWSLAWEDFPWRRKWQTTPLFLPGEFHGQREPGGLQSMGSQRVGHNWLTLLLAGKICPPFSKYSKKNITFEREKGVYLGVTVSFMIIQCLWHFFTFWYVNVKRDVLKPLTMIVAPRIFQYF